MYKFLGIQSRKDATNEYQPKGNYLTPSDYERMYGKAIDLKFKGYLPIGDYTLNSNFNAYKDNVSKTYAPLSELSNYQPKGDYTLKTDFNAYTKDAETKFNNLTRFAGVTEEIMKKSYKDIENLNNSLSGYQPKGDYVTLSQFNTYTKDADTKFNNLIRFAGTTEQFIREFNQLKTELKPAFNEIQGYAQKTYLTKEEFESFKQKLMDSTPSINTAFTPVTKLPPPSYLRHKNYMNY